MSRRTRRAPAADGVGLSFLDVLSNGLGAAILLFIILSALQGAGAIVLQGGEQFIRLTWTVTDPQAMIQAWVSPPGTADRKRLFVDIGDSTSGSQICVAPYAPGGIVMFGFTQRGTDAAVSQDASDGRRVFIMRIQSPEKGEWRAGALYFNRADALATRPPSVEVTFEAQGSIHPIEPKKVTLAFAEQIEFPSIIPTGEPRAEVSALLPRCVQN